MEIINSTLKSTLIEELCLCLISAIAIPSLVFMMLSTSSKIVKTKFIKFFGMLLSICLILIAWKMCLGRVYEYEILEVKVTDWNTILNTGEYELIYYEGNTATLKKIHK